jgi:hypothetical protein
MLVIGALLGRIWWVADPHTHKNAKEWSGVPASNTGHHAWQLPHQFEDRSKKSHGSMVVGRLSGDLIGHLVAIVPPVAATRRIASIGVEVGEILSVGGRDVTYPIAQARAEYGLVLVTGKGVGIGGGVGILIHWVAFQNRLL